LILKTRQTGLGGVGPVYQREFSGVDGHIHSFYPSVTRLWNNLPIDLRNCDKGDIFASKIKKINVSELRRNLKAID